MVLLNKIRMLPCDMSTTLNFLLKSYLLLHFLAHLYPIQTCQAVLLEVTGSLSPSCLMAPSVLNDTPLIMVGEYFEFLLFEVPLTYNPPQIYTISPKMRFAILYFIFLWEWNCPYPDLYFFIHHSFHWAFTAKHQGTAMHTDINKETTPNWLSLSPLFGRWDWQSFSS